MSSLLRVEQPFGSGDPVDAARVRAIGARSVGVSSKWVLAVAGRLAAVAIPTALLAYPRGLTVAAAAGLIVVSVGFWWMALRLAFRTTLLALGPAVAAAAGTSIGLLLVSALALWVPSFGASPTRLLEIAALVFLLTTGWERLVQKRLAQPQKVLILGTPELAADLAEHADRTPDRRFELVGVVSDSGELPEPAVLGTLRDLAEVVDAQTPDLIVLANTDAGAAVDRLLEASWRKFRVVGLSHFFEHAYGRVPLAHISPAWFMSILHLRQRTYDGWSKRAFDVTIASIALVLTAPLFVAVAIAVRLSGKPVLFKQTRLGERGKTFRMYKFRTMIRAGEPDGAARWAEEADPRVTEVGRFLRRSRLDELPQLWNVIRGEMSVVGPRPERPEFVRLLEENVPYWNRRLLVKPGLTGWAQIRSGYAADCDATFEKLSYDLWYVRHRTLLLDLAICAKTFVTLVSGAGAR